MADGGCDATDAEAARRAVDAAESAAQESQTESLRQALDLIRSRPLLIFDFDGVLVDTVGIKAEGFAALYRRYGAAAAAQAAAYHRRHGGMNRREKIRRCHQLILHRSPSADELEDLTQQFAAWAPERIVAAPEIPGARRFLDDCARRPCFVNSATPQAELHTIIARRGWRRYFRGLYGAPASKAANLRAIGAAAGVAADQSLFFGDALADLNAAEEVGVAFIGIAAQADSPLRAARIPLLADFRSLCEPRMNTDEHG